VAFLIPADIESFHTEGERQFYLFLMKVAKPDPGYKKKQGSGIKKIGLRK